MNWILFGLVVPSACAVFVVDLFTAYFVSKQSESESRTTWGPLHHRGLFALSATTFVVSVVGCCLSFFLFMLRENEEYVSVCAFIVWNMSSIVSKWALLHTHRTVVLVCLVTNTVCGITLFVYTGIIFDLLQTVSQTPAVLVAHCCNAVTVFHVTIIDLIFWYDGWVASVRTNDPPLIAVWGGEPDHASDRHDQMRL
jgi:hypothetical protein